MVSPALKTFRVMAVTVSVVMSALVSAQPVTKPSLAVSATVVSEVAKNLPIGSKIDFQELTMQIESGLKATREFDVFERSEAVLGNSVVKEQEFAVSGRALADAAQIGKMNNVRIIAQPMISNFTMNVRRQPNEEAPGRFLYSGVATAEVTLKLLDTEAAKILYQKSIKINGTKTASDLKEVTGAHDNDVAAVAIWNSVEKQLGEMLTLGVAEHINPLQVMQMQNNSIFVNKGDGSGLKIGDVFQVFAKGDELIDPVTKEILGDSESLIGEAAITRVNPRFSVATPIGRMDQPAKAGDIFRRK